MFLICLLSFISLRNPWALGLSLVPLTFIIGMVLMKIGLVVALVTRLPASKQTAPVDGALPTQPVHV